MRLSKGVGILSGVGVLRLRVPPSVRHGGVHTEHIQGVVSVVGITCQS